MLRQSFNQGWMHGAGTDVWAVLATQDPGKTVLLPYDSMLDQDTTPDAASGSSKGYYPDFCIALEKKFFVPEDWQDKAVYFEFEGVYTNASVLINNDCAAVCPNGYMDFLVRSDSFLRFGQMNRIKVIARTSTDSRWYSGAGIYRNVKLLVSDLVHISPDSYRAHTAEADEEGALIALRMEIANDGHASRYVTAVTTVYDAEGNAVANAETFLTAFGGKSTAVRQRIYVDGAKRWELEDPYLYRIETKLCAAEQPGQTASENTPVLDEEAISFGIRTLQLDARHGLRLNGKTVKLRGACVHHDNGVLGSADIDRAEERRVELLKKAGFNAVRSAHNPISKAFLNACDKNGMIVMDELTDMWAVAKTNHDYSTSFPLHWKEITRSMIAKDYNHPCVVFYSIGNEIPETGTSKGAEIARGIVEEIKALDEIRYTVNALNVFLSVMPKIKEMLEGKLGAEINETMQNLGGDMSNISNSEIISIYTRENYDLLDVCGYNYATGRYQLDGEQFPNRVLMGSETFPKDIAGNWREITKYPHAIGDFTWTGWDYLGEAGIGRMEYAEDGAEPGFAGMHPWRIAYCGDLDIIGNRRPISYYREIVFGLRKKPYITCEYPWNFSKTLVAESNWSFIDAIGSWSWKGYEGKMTRVHVFGDGDRFELLVNGQKKAEGTLENLRGCAELPFEPGEITAVVYRGDAVWETETLCSASGKAKLTAVPDRTTLRTDDGDLSYISIAMLGENGVVDNMANKAFTVQVEGAGYLAGAGSADPKTTENYTAPTHMTFDGAALAVVRPTGSGEIHVTVSADGMEAVCLTLNAE